MSVVAVIPARYPSQRFPGKPLQMLKGASGTARSLLERTHAAAAAAKGIDRIVVATDDERIADHARPFADVVMTSDQCRNGTERCAEVLQTLKSPPDIVLNVQGDAPLTPPDFIEALIDGIGDAGMATPILPCTRAMLERFREDRRAGRVGGTLAVTARDLSALYFSKEVIPFADRITTEAAAQTVFHHVGLYAYRPDALAAYMAWPPGTLEMREGLEQLRFLENGARVRCVPLDAKGREFWELNNPVDVARVEAALAAAGID
ncbi:MAG: manno-octulosonate cytidylyltransferase [Pseudomonadota bacterium]